MKWLNAFYIRFCKVEEMVVAALIASITTLVFVSALSRFVGVPLNWATDVALLGFAWLVFLGADVALRNVGFIRIDMLVTRFPRTLQVVLHYVFTALAVVVLLIIAYFGTHLALSSTKRLYQTLGISYSWATISAPVGAVLMLITLLRREWMNRRDPLAGPAGQEAI